MRSQALDPDDPSTDDDLIEELGDLLYQVEFHATIAEQQGRFTIADVARRHPRQARPPPPARVRRRSQADDAGTVVANWDAIKRAEKGRTASSTASPRRSRHSAYAYHVQRKAAKVGFDWPDVDGRVAQDRRGDRRADRGASMAATERASTTSSATCCSRSSTSPATSTSSPRPRCAPRPTSSGAASKASSDWPPSAASTMSSADLATLDALWDEVKVSSVDGTPIAQW